MEFHEVASIFPLMSAEEYRALVADIQEHGLREPIWTYQGQIIDGRNRYQACAELGLVPPTREWDGHGSLVSFVVSLNLHRRHLDESQRARVAEKLATMRQGERTDLSAIAERLSQDEVAALLNVSTDSIGRARKVRETGIPELGDMVDRGKASVSAAALVAELPAAEQREIVARGEAGG